MTYNKYMERLNEHGAKLGAYSGMVFLGFALATAAPPAMPLSIQEAAAKLHGGNVGMCLNTCATWLLLKIKPS